MAGFLFYIDLLPKLWGRTFYKCSRLFYFQEEYMQKKEQSSRQILMCHLVDILGVDIEKATQLIDELEQVGLIQFDEFGNIGVLVLEGQS